jgi:hypothetical protein
MRRVCKDDPIQSDVAETLHPLTRCFGAPLDLWATSCALRPARIGATTQSHPSRQQPGKCFAHQARNQLLTLARHALQGRSHADGREPKSMDPNILQERMQAIYEIDRAAPPLL